MDFWGISSIVKASLGKEMLFGLKKSYSSSSEHETNTEQASRTNVSGLCEVIVKCGRTLDIPHTFAMGARLAQREDGEKRSVRFLNIMEIETELFGGRSGETKTKNFPFLFLSAPSQIPPPKK